MVVKKPGMSGSRCPCPSPHLCYLHARFPEVEAMQVSLEPGVDVLTRGGVRLCPAERLLRQLP